MTITAAITSSGRILHFGDWPTASRAIKAQGITPYGHDSIYPDDRLRASLIQTCLALDPNGNYTDLDCISQAMEPMTLDELKAQVIKLLAD